MNNFQFNMKKVLNHIIKCMFIVYAMGYFFGRYIHLLNDKLSLIFSSIIVKNTSMSSSMSSKYESLNKTFQETQEDLKKIFRKVIKENKENNDKSS